MLFIFSVPVHSQKYIHFIFYFMNHTQISMTFHCSSLAPYILLYGANKSFHETNTLGPWDAFRIWPVLPYVFHLEVIYNTTSTDCMTFYYMVISSFNNTGLEKTENLDHLSLQLPVSESSPVYAGLKDCTLEQSDSTCPVSGTWDPRKANCFLN